MRGDEKHFKDYEMPFPQRIAAIRKSRSFTQRVLAEEAGISLIQLRRYEGGSSKPTMDVIKSLAIVLGVSSDALIFDKDERDPDQELKYLFEAVSRFDSEDKKVARAVLDGLVLKNQAKKLMAQSDSRSLPGSSKEQNL